MAIKILKLTTKETLIGEIETDNIDLTEDVVLHDPMIIDIFFDDSDNTVMRLRSALSLSVEDFLIFQPKHILTFYTPPSIMVRYYTKIRQNIRSDKQFVNDMIKEAIDDLDANPDIQHVHSDDVKFH